jgi:hypothetical protein
MFLGQICATVLVEFCKTWSRQLCVNVVASKDFEADKKGLIVGWQSSEVQLGLLLHRKIVVVISGIFLIAELPSS